MTHPVLYLGDTSLDRAASYLGAVMAHINIRFCYVPSDKAVPDSLLRKAFSCIIISDYPAKNFTKLQLALITGKVMAGMGLIMIGGWESFTGSAGGYNKTMLAKALPVALSNKDDRLNTSNPCVVIKKNDHQILKGLPLSGKLPCVAGFQRLKAKPNASELLSIRVFEAGSKSFKQKAEYPLLVIGRYGQGKTAAFASDVAPHWVGGLVDWGKKRVTAQAKGGQEIEMGEYYAKLFTNIINFTRGL